MLDTALDSQDDPAIQSLLEIACRSTERIQRLTDSLLDIKRLEAGQPVGNRQPVSPETLVEETLKAIAHLAENKKQKIEVTITPGLPEVFVEPEMIQRVLINLLENAVKYSPQGSKILLSAQTEKDWVQLSVRDYGPGIPPDDAERIFDKFTRLRTKEADKGIGLGLAFCRLAVEGHSGRIWVETTPGSGAIFKFTLPVSSGSARSYRL
jgi:signal transduction histidine kinase